jgi:hypothetical protein
MNNTRTIAAAAAQSVADGTTPGSSEGIQRTTEYIYREIFHY